MKTKPLNISLLYVDVNTLLTRADEKMFEAKKLGKNRFSY